MRHDLTLEFLNFSFHLCMYYYNFQIAGIHGAAQYQPGYGNPIPGAGALAGLQMAMPQAIPVPSASPPTVAAAQVESKKRVMQEIAGLQVAG